MRKPRSFKEYLLSTFAMWANSAFKRTAGRGYRVS